MARAISAPTWLPLDRWARILGINPYHFNGLTHTTCNHSSSCTGIWYQHITQSNKISKEEVAIAISDAERMLSDFVGYNLLPDWDTFDGNPPRYYDPNYHSNVTAQYRPKSVRLPRGYVHAGGVRVCDVVEKGYTFTTVDLDGDGFEETVRVVVNDADVTDADTIRIYYPDKGPDDIGSVSKGWEVRPLTFKTLSSPFTIEFPRYLLVKASITEGLCQPDSYEYSDTSAYETTVDIYKCYNDSTTDPVNLIYLPDAGCQADCDEISYTDCLNVVDYINGYATYNRQGRREPDRLNINYYSGWVDKSLDRPFSELDLFWEVAITALSVSLLDKKVHCCGGNDCDIASRWARAMNIIDQSSNYPRQYLVTQIMLNNPFGIITEGSWFAYQRAFTRKLR